MITSKIREVSRLFCEHAVEAIERYSRFTDWDSAKIDETYIHGRILDTLSDRGIPVLMKIRATTVWDWTFEGLPPRASLLAYNPVFDYVIDHDNADRDVLALVELKRHNKVGGDRWKLQQILPHFPNVFGVSLGIAKRPADDWRLDEAATNCNLVCSEPKTIRGRSFFGFAYIDEPPASI